MFQRDLFGSSKVGDRTRHPQHAVVRARRPLEADHGLAQFDLGLAAMLTQALDFARGQEMIELALPCKLPGCSGVPTAPASMRWLTGSTVPSAGTSVLRIA